MRPLLSFLSLLLPLLAVARLLAASPAGRHARARRARGYAPSALPEPVPEPPPVPVPVPVSPWRPAVRIPDYPAFCAVADARPHWNLSFAFGEDVPYRARHHGHGITLAADNLDLLVLVLDAYVPPAGPRPYVDCVRAAGTSRQGATQEQEAGR